MRALKRIFAGLAAFVVFLIIALLLWGLAEPYVLDTEEQTAQLPNLPPAWQGQRFALMADWQIGMWGANRSTIREAVAALVRARPAFVLIAGDFVYHAGSGDAEEVEHAVRLLRPLLDAGLPTYAVLGNHDYGMQKPDSPPDELLAHRVAAALRAAGVRVLDNEAAALRLPAAAARSAAASPGAALYVVGIAASWPGRAAPAEALAQVPAGAPRLVLMHNPNAFEDVPAGAAPVALAGHTHGGQVRLPFAPETSWMSYFKSDAVHADGWIPPGYGRAGNRLYVNRGIGFSLLPLRINAPPELTFFTLQAPQPSS